MKNINKASKTRQPNQKKKKKQKTQYLVIYKETKKKHL